MRKKEDIKTKVFTLALRPVLLEALVDACNARGVRPTEMVKTLIADWAYANSTKTKAAS